MRINYEEKLRNRVVIDANGRAIGEVDALLLDTQSWTVDGLRVKLRSEAADELGLQRGTFRAAMIEVPASMLQGAGDTVLLRVTLEALRPAATEPPPAPPP